MVVIPPGRHRRDFLVVVVVVVVVIPTAIATVVVLTLSVVVARGARIAPRAIRKVAPPPLTPLTLTSTHPGTEALLILISSPVT